MYDNNHRLRPVTSGRRHETARLEPAFDASMVGVTTVGGIATLSGYVDTHEAKLAAERAARRVYGVRAVANELDVRFAHEKDRSLTSLEMHSTR